MYDMKPDAPAEYRGEFRPIRTRVPGLDLCELMPRQALGADRFSLLRNLKFKGDVEHIPPEVLTGVTRGRPTRPPFGSVVSRLQGSRSGLPPYVSMMGREGLGFEDPSYVGVNHRPFIPNGAALENLSLSSEVSLDRFAERTTLLQTFDTLRRDLDPKQSGHDAFNAQALEMMISPRVRDAFAVDREPAQVRHRYGQATQFLLARRLVEAGVRVVTINSLNGHNWDSHQSNFKSLRQTLPLYDQGVAALLDDLYDRGLNEEVLVVIWGEMGRTPKINDRDAGRDHWWEAGFGLVAGGGLPMGQVIGVTDRRAEQITSHRYTPQNMLATIYTVLGIDPKATLPDYSGRPIYLLDDPKPIEELV
jgi:hypothetical protein